MKNVKKSIIGLLLVLICIMAIAYAYLAQQLRINGNIAIGSTWNVRITNIEEKEKTVGASSKISPTYDATTATFNVGFISPGDYIIYEIEVSNLGTLDAVIDNINVSVAYSDAIRYTVSGIKKGNKLAANNKVKIQIKIEYKSEFTTQPQVLDSSINVAINYIDAYGVESNDESEDMIFSREPNHVGDVVEFADTEWRVIKSSTAAEDYLTLLKEEPFTLEDLRSVYCYSCNREDVTWSYDSTSYSSSNVRSYLDTYASHLGTNNLKEVDGYKIRLLTREELNGELGCTGGNCTSSPYASWLYQNGGSYWIMPSMYNNQLDLSVVGNNGGIFWTDVYYENPRTSYRDYQYSRVKPVINLLKTAIE